ncbi:MAG: amidohydrolase [Phycisphaeraceae bacterium]|nr:amidohydrolase [Phycisphaeraceae bacterium]
MPQNLLLIHGDLLDAGDSPSARGAVVRRRGAAVLIHQGLIVALGSEDAVRSRARGDETLVDLAGRAVTPGLVDSHCHLDGVGMASLCPDLSATTSKAQCLEVIRHAAVERAKDPAQAKEWLLGLSFNINTWPPPEAQNLSLADLDAATGDIPSVLVQFDGHSCWVNSAALRASGVDPAAPPEAPTGGRLGRDAKGKLNGLLYENAMGLLRLPPPTREQRTRNVRLGMTNYAKNGYTNAHVVGSGNHLPITELLDIASELHASDGPMLRIRGYPLVEHLDAAQDHRHRRARDIFHHVAGLKTFFDGSLNSHTAWMLQPYQGEGDNTGLTVISPEELRRQVAQSNTAGFPLACHAIGDRAVRELLDAIEAVGSPDLVNRVEHAQHLSPEDLGRFARLNAVASMQTCHMLPDWKTADRILGPRARWSYAAQSLLDAGATVILGSDAPVVPCDPRDSLLSAVWRVDHVGEPHGGWHPRERLTPEQWLWMHTRGPALVTGEANHFGTFELGTEADLTIWSRDPLAAATTGPEAIKALTIDGTILAGTFTHRAW